MSAQILKKTGFLSGSALLEETWCIQLLMLMFLADTVEYGQWKLGKRNEGVTFSIQPFINKLGGAAASGMAGYVIVLSGINSAPDSRRCYFNRSVDDENCNTAASPYFNYCRFCSILSYI